MNLFSEIWKIATAAWVQIARSLTCILLSTRLAILNSQIESAKRYIESVRESSSNLTKSFARYFEEKLPIWTAERESLEAQLEINGCKED
jgi:hypothetical protein